MDIVLRDYQKAAVAALEQELKRERTALLCLPTGSGKSETIFVFIKNFILNNPSARVLFAVNKVGLVEQTYKRASRVFDQELAVFCGTLNKKELAAFTIASVQSIYKLKDMPEFDLIVFDEAHRINLTKGSQYDGVISRTKAKIIGLTATPYRNDGYIYGPDKLFKRVCYSKDIEWAIGKGWLINPSLKHTPKQFDTSKLNTRMGDFDARQVKELTTSSAARIREQVQDASSRLEGRNKVIWQCSCVEHAQMLKDALGWGASIVHSNMTKKERDKNMHDFEFGSNRHLVFVMVVSEGIDIPCIDAIVLMRPTKSALVMVQTIGRGLRLYEGLKDCLVLDYGSVVANCGPLNNPNIPQGKGVKAVITGMKFCPKCLEYVPANAATCSACDHDFIAAKLAEQKSLISNTSLRPDTESHLFQPGSRGAEWISIDPNKTRAVVYKARSGNLCVQFSFTKHGLIGASYNKFIVVEGANPRAFKFSKKTIETMMQRDFDDCITAEDYVREINKIGIKHITSIQVDLSGEWPKIMGYRNDDSQRKKVHGNDFTQDELPF